MRREKRQRAAHKIHIPQWAVWYVLFMIVIIFWHLLMHEYIGDAVTNFSKGLDSDTLINILKRRYNNWSSRVIIEGLLYLIARYVNLWKLCNIAVYALFAYSLLYLTDFKHPKLTLGLWLTYPVIEMASAGWIATYMNYFWPLAMCTYAMISLHKLYNGKKIHLIEWLTFSLAALFAANVEQVCVLYACVLTGFGIDYFLIQKSKKGFVFYILQWIITLGNIAFICLSRGNSVRTWKEIGMRMQDFGTMSIIDKGVLGVVVTMGKLVTANLNFLIFVTVIFAISILNRYYSEKKTTGLKKLITRICFALPFAAAVGLTVFKTASETFFPQIVGVLLNYVRVDAENWYNLKYYVPFIVYMVMIMAILVALLNLFEDVKKSFMLAALFMTGLLSRVVLGFSPTLYASNMRTFIFFDAVIIFIIVLMYCFSAEVRKKLPQRVHKAASYIFTAAVVISVINNAVAVCARI